MLRDEFIWPRHIANDIINKPVATWKDELLKVPEHLRYWVREHLLDYYLKRGLNGK